MAQFSFNKVTEQNGKGLAILAVVAVVIVLVVFFAKDIKAVLQNLLVSLGLEKDPATALAEGNAMAGNISSANPSSPFSPAMYTNNPGASTLDYPTLQTMAKTIYDSVSWLPNIIDTPSASQALAAIKQCNNQVDVSNLTVVFKDMYNDDLYDYMARNYTSSLTVQAMNQIINFVSTLPTT